MNETIRLLATRKSERSFTDEPVADDQLEAVLRAGYMAPTSCNGQHVSVIVVKDAAKRAKIAELAGNQPWVAKVPVFLVIVCDLYKLNKGVERAGSAMKVQDCIEGVIMSSLDCGIAMAQMATAAMSLGLGTVPIGGIRNNPGEIIELLGLPPLTYAPLGLCVGHVKKPGLGRPRLAFTSFRHDEAYDGSGLDEAITAYDKELFAYWQEHGRPDGQNWSDSVAPRFDNVERPKLKPVLLKQGMPFTE